MRGRLWTDAERDEIRRRRVAGEQWHVIGASYGASGDAVRRAAATGGFKATIVGQPRPTPRAPDTSVMSAPAIQTTRTRAEGYLIISDLQIPYHHPGALEFCKRVRFEFGVPLENVICVGDEFDFYWLSRFEKAADAPHSGIQEIEVSRIEIARWAAAFPHLRICDSNHVGGRMASAASRGGLARPFIREVREVFGLPETWRWSESWTVPASRHPFRVEHGHKRPLGHAGLRAKPMFRGISTAWGHEHAEPAVIHLESSGKSVWGMRCGSLITKEPVPAFDYNSEDASRPVGSVGVVLDGGRTPLVVRM